ncbi:MAG: ABC transporter ATP-binding protein [Anaerolineae bacterium]|nr:ABC transporter ATP-binding protein/permease [Thermoflexales bacterium]MDW8407929.1 ABC transporter ATP-binding protein [Anaerolineae bacterium]
MMMGLASEAYDRTYSDRQLIRRLAAYFLARPKHVVLAAVLILAITLFGLLDPLIVSRGLDAVLARPSPELTLALFAYLLFSGVITFLAGLVRRRVMARLVGDVISQMRHEAFSASIRHDLSFFDKFQSGKIISRITNDTQELSQVVLLVTDLISQFTTLIALVVVLFSASWQLTLALLIMSPFVALFGAAFRNLARRVTRTGFRAIAEVNQAIQEAVAGIRVSKNFRQEAAMYAAFRTVNQQSYRVNLLRGFVLANVFPTLNALAGIGTALLLYLGGRAAGEGAISVGAWYLFILSVERFWFPMTNIASFYSQIQSGLSASERVFALIDAEHSVKQIATQPVPHLRGDIRFERVCFRYNEQQQVLQDFSLHIRPGESVAFVGHTGAGKSSIAKLIARFYEFQEGSILIDGHDIRSFDLNDYRRQLGIVSQTPFLFAGTVADNIRYARPDATNAEILAIANRVGDGEWLESLPNGLHSEVGERGNRLSMGQRQLIALMRVLLQAPPIFILDEATASVDPFTESQIQRALSLILARSTSILIAHRLFTVRSVDRIIALDHGRIIEEGSHQALLQRGGYYATLYQTYFRHQSPDYRVEGVDYSGGRVRLRQA